MRAVAKALSVVLHPVWMPTAIVVLAFSLHPYLALRFIGDGRIGVLYTMVFVMTAVFPLLSVWMFKRGGMVRDWTMPLREERTLVYAITLMYCGMCYWLLRRTAGHPMVLSLFLGGCVVLAAVLLINLRWKISAHMAGICGLLGALLALMLLQGVQAPLLFAALVALAGALGTARLLITDHTPTQVYAGALLGLVGVLGCALFGLRI